MSTEMIPGAVLASLLVVLASHGWFRDQPATRRLFVILASQLLLAIPVACLLLDVRWTVGLPADMGLAGARWPEGDGLWAGLWLVGLLLAALHGVRVLRERRHMAAWPDVDDPLARETLAELKAESGYPGRIRLKRGAQPCSATLGGAVVVLPDRARGWSRSTLRAVLAHELVHVSRRDDAWRVLLALVVRLFWWLPWLRLMQRHLDQAVEQSCDDAASALTGDHRQYLKGLLEAAVTGSTYRSAVALDGASLVARFRRFAGVRHGQVDPAGLYWAVLAVSLLLMSLWSVHLTVVEPAGERSRIVARVLTAEAGSAASDGEEGTARQGDLRFHLRLKEPPRQPLNASSGLDPPG